MDNEASSNNRSLPRADLNTIPDHLMDLITPPTALLKLAGLQDNADDIAYIMVVDDDWKSQKSDTKHIECAVNDDDNNGDDEEHAEEVVQQQHSIDVDEKIDECDTSSGIMIGEAQCTSTIVDCLPKFVKGDTFDSPGSNQTMKTSDMTECDSPSVMSVDSKHAIPVSTTRELPDLPILGHEGQDEGLEVFDILRQLNNTALINNIAKLVECNRRERKLLKQMQQVGIAVAEDIPYEEAKMCIAQIAQRMNEIGRHDVADPQLREEYFKLEQSMDRYMSALVLTDEWQKEQEQNEMQWEVTHAAANVKALQSIRRHMPVSVRSMTTEELTTVPGPSGKCLPKTMVVKFKRTNVLQLLRIDPDSITRMHPSTLESLRVTGLTLTERRALHVHLQESCKSWKCAKDDPMVGRKWKWYEMMKSTFRDTLNAYESHIQQYGPPESHPYATRGCKEGCPLIGKQCPVAANAITDYSGDYGYPEGDEYEAVEVQTSSLNNSPSAEDVQSDTDNAKMNDERAAVLKKHYKNKLFEYTQALGCCETMNDMDVLLKRACMHWKRDMQVDCDMRPLLSIFSDCLSTLKVTSQTVMTRANAVPDKRCVVEAGVSDDLFDNICAFVQYIKDQMCIYKLDEKKISSSCQQLLTWWTEVHLQNQKIYHAAQVCRPERSLTDFSADDVDILPTVSPAKHASEEPITSKSTSSTDSDSSSGSGIASVIHVQRIKSGGGKNNLLAAIAARKTIE